MNVRSVILKIKKDNVSLKDLLLVAFAFAFNRTQELVKSVGSTTDLRYHFLLVNIQIMCQHSFREHGILDKALNKRFLEVCCSFCACS